MRAAGVCHSDLHTLRGELRASPPLVLGHEGAGIVEKVGANVRKLAPGGVIALHVSNSHLDLPPLIRRLSDAHDPPLNVRYCHDVPLDPERDDGKTESQWMLLGRTAADLAPIVDRRYTKQSLIWWNEVPWEDGPIWRDDFANLLRVWKKNTPKD